MLRNRIIIASGIVALATVHGEARSAVTFLHHFNSSDTFDIQAGNGDYSTGDTSAAVTGSPGVDTGFFPGSLPGNLAYHATINGQPVDFTASTGAVGYTTATTGGITAGAWVKFSGSYRAGTVFTIGEPTLTDDYVRIDYGNSLGNVPRATFRDGVTTNVLNGPTPIDATQWVYLATTVDLTHALLTLYAYDASGVALHAPATTAISVSNWNVANPLATGSMIRIGGQMDPSATGIWVDEFSIDNEVLTADQIGDRVASMAAGHQLIVPEPSTATLLAGAMCAGAVRRRRR